MRLSITDRLEDSANYNKWTTRLQYAAFAMLLFGMKLWVITTYGNATPYWDQWDAEGANLYKPFSDGSLGISEMIAPHNEHRIFTTRVLALILLAINKSWNPLLQMVVNAGLHIITIMFAILLLTRIIGRKYLPALLGFSFLLYSFPYAWENTLAGFQSQFYFVFLFGTASLWFTVIYEPLSRNWWIGIGLSLLAFFSLASGIFALAASVTVNLIIFFSNLRRTRKQLAGIGILAFLFIIGYKLTPSLPQHETLKATSFSQFYHSLVATLGWPMSSGLFSAVVRNLPGLVFIIMLLRERPAANDKRWFILAIIVWSLGQSLSIAQGRAAGSLSSRYLDLFAVGILINFVCLISLFRSNYFSKRGVMGLATFGWSGLIFISLASLVHNSVMHELEFKRTCSQQEEINTRNYLASGDFNHLKDKPFLYIPYPDADRLAEILNMPEIRKILPANIRPAFSPVSVDSRPVDAFIGNGYFYTTPKRADTSWGSHNAQGDTATGQLFLKFNADKNARIEIPVAGYPLGAGMKVEVEQNGKLTAVSIASDPKESWGTGYARVKKGPFTINVTDASPKYWTAVGLPSTKWQGRLDRLTEKVLSKYYLFLLAGFIIVLYLFTDYGFLRDIQENKDRSNEFSTNK
jgi:hypothetical protein